MSATARAKENEIREALRAVVKAKDEKRPALVVGLYQLMRLEFEDKLISMCPDNAANPIPRSRPAKLAGRDAPTVDASIARLMAFGLVRETERGYDLPQVRRIFEIRSRDRSYKSDDHPPGRNSDLLGSETGSEFRSETPPLVSPFPTTLSSSLPSKFIHSQAENPQNGDDLDRKLREFIGGHRMLTWTAVNHGIARKMAESGGWTGMVQALDTAIAQGVSEPFTYARKVMAGDQAKNRLKIGREADKPTFQRVTKARTFDV